jgi:putative PIN family toxin of toxin-antitoxin system
VTRFPFRIVADPNVLIAAAITRNPDSPVRTLVTAVTQGRVQLITCPTLWAELTAVLARPKISSRLAPGGGERFVHALRLLATEVDDPTPISRVVSDPRDDYLIALARQERAHRLISGDQAVLAASVAELRILTPREFADELGM